MEKIKEGAILIATKQTEVFIDKCWYGQPIENSQISRIPESRRVDISWKGCSYILNDGEEFRFDRANNWDACFFELQNKAEFKIETCDIMTIVERYKFKVKI